MHTAYSLMPETYPVKAHTVLNSKHKPCINHVLLNFFETRKMSMLSAIINVFFITKQHNKIARTALWQHYTTVKAWHKMFYTSGRSSRLTLQLDHHIIFQPLNNAWLVTPTFMTNQAYLTNTYAKPKHLHHNFQVNFSFISLLESNSISLLH